jgi:hypothetical protein
VPFRDVSPHVAELDAEHGLLDGGPATTELLFSGSDSAKSCSMISPFSHFSAFLVLPAHVLAKIVNTAKVVTTAMNTRLSISGLSPTSMRS